MINAWKENLALGWNLGRTLQFTSEQRLLPWVQRIATGKKPWEPPELALKRKQLLEAALLLLKKDAANIGKGVYPVSVLKPEPYWKHGVRLLALLADAATISRRRQRREFRKFSSEFGDKLKNLPAYYRRNFHYQTNGYLSPDSAELYDHQVDLLFLGTTDAMRRSLIAPLKERLPNSPNLLELGCGTGRLTRFVSLAMPSAKILAVDPSEPYLKKARAGMPPAAHVQFSQGFAETKKFKPRSVHGVYSSFLFHELPREVRRRVLENSVRALKPGGWIALVDSLQIGDQPQFDWALRRFPVDFHEPFYKSYTEDPMENWPQEIKGLRHVETRFAFLSKMCLFQVTKK